jgi:glucose/arabinose dehydrogenase
VAVLGFTFYTADAFPARYQGGAFIGEHGSWNRAQLTGYKVTFVPFVDGKPNGLPEDFLTGFLKGDGSDAAYGRPVGVAVAKDGALLVADDVGNIVWRVAPAH